MFKTILENHLKSKAPQVEQDLMDQCHLLLDDVSKKNEVSPYDLSLLFKVVDGRLIGEVINREAKVLTAFDAGGLFTEMFQEQMKAVPQVLHQQILAQLGGEKLEQLLVSLFNEDYLLIRYNIKQSLELHHITANKSEIISIKVFIEELKL